MDHSYVFGLFVPRTYKQSRVRIGQGRYEWSMGRIVQVPQSGAVVGVCCNIVSQAVLQRRHYVTMTSKVFRKTEIDTLYGLENTETKI